MTEKKTLQVSEILADFKQGFTDEELKSKYGLSQHELNYALEQMVANKQLDLSALQAHRLLEAGLLEIPEHLPAQYRTKAVWGIVVGILACIVGSVFLAIDLGLQTVSLLCWFAGFVAFIWGCCYLAKSKGYHGALGLLGIMVCIGLLILLLIPNRFKDVGSPTSAVQNIVLVVLGVVIMMGIIAVVLPTYVQHNRAWADGAANGDVLGLGSAIQRLAIETVHANGDWDTLCKKIDNTNIKWLLGTHYGFKGTNQKAGVRILVDTNKNEIRGFALKGSRPAGQQSRYVHRVSICTGGELPADCSTEDFSKYFPISETCYTTSMVTGSGRHVTYTKPKGSLPCSELPKRE